MINYLALLAALVGISGRNLWCRDSINGVAWLLLDSIRSALTYPRWPWILLSEVFFSLNLVNLVYNNNRN